MLSWCPHCWPLGGPSYVFVSHVLGRPYCPNDFSIIFFYLFIYLLDKGRQPDRHTISKRSSFYKFIFWMSATARLVHAKARSLVLYTSLYELQGPKYLWVAASQLLISRKVDWEQHLQDSSDTAGWDVGTPSGVPQMPFSGLVSVCLCCYRRFVSWLGSRFWGRSEHTTA